MFPVGLPTQITLHAGKYSKQYPNVFCEQTIKLADGYPMYKRPDNGLSIQIGAILDNRLVVPYNPMLQVLSSHVLKV